MAGPRRRREGAARQTVSPALTRASAERGTARVHARGGGEPDRHGGTPARHADARAPHRRRIDRHDAIHAVASVLAEHMYTLMKKPGTICGDPNQPYYDGLSRLTADDWRSGS